MLVSLPGALAFLNHLLAGADWAVERLRPFAGKTARLELGALRFALEIGPDGLFRAGDAAADAPVSITLPADAPWRLWRGRDALLAAAQISGSAELAETLAFIFRHLRWDLEADLAPLLGDIAAHRIVEGGRRFSNWQLEQAEKLAANFAEYLTEEARLIATRRDLTAFSAQVREVDESLARLEQRIAAREN